MANSAIVKMRKSSASFGLYLILLHEIIFSVLKKESRVYIPFRFVCILCLNRRINGYKGNNLSWA